MKDKISFIFALGLTLLFMSIPDPKVSGNEVKNLRVNKLKSSNRIQKSVVRSRTDSLIKSDKFIRVIATKYNPVESQCDDTPLITANNSKIDLDDLNSYKIRWCAISRDLLVEYKLGSIIHIESKNPKITGYWRIMDVMNPRWKYRIDLLMPLNDNTGFSKELVKIQKVKI